MVVREDCLLAGFGEAERAVLADWLLTEGLTHACSDLANGIPTEVGTVTTLWSIPDEIERARVAAAMQRLSAHSSLFAPRLRCSGWDSVERGK